jgi:hypothetical protein
MGNYQPGKMPEGKFIDPKWLNRELLKVQTGLNFLDERNFPNKLAASDVIGDGTVKLNHTSGSGEFRIPILALATAASITATTLTSLGGFANFDPARWAGVPMSNIYLELTAGPGLASSPLTVEIWGTAGALASTTLSTVGLTYSAVPFTSLPASSQALTLKAKVGSTTAGSIITASILIRP